MRKKVRLQKWIAAMTLGIFVFPSSYPPPVYAANPVLEVPAFSDSFKFTVSPELGVIREIHPGSSDQIVIHIQDAHANYSAQKNIARLIDHLKQNYGFNTVAVEGAPKGEIDTTPISWLPVKSRLTLVLDSLLRQSFITGPEYQHAASRQGFQYIGIEDPALYRQNLSEYLDGTAIREELTPSLQAMRREISEIKRQAFNEKLYELDQLIQQRGQFQTSGRDGLIDYLKKLFDAAIDQKIALEPFDQISSLLKAEQSGRLLDTEAVKNDVRMILTSLAGGSYDEVVKALFDPTKSFAQAEELEHKMTDQGIAVKQFPAFKQYLEYLNLMTRFMHQTQLDEQQTKLENVLKEKLVLKEEERSVREADDYLSLVEGLIRLELTRDQYHAYLRKKNKWRLDDLGKWIRAYQKSFRPEDDLNRKLQPFEYFYESAVRRDKVLIQNVMDQFPKSGKVILVAGGFHTDGLEAQLREKGVTYAVVSPKISDFSHNDHEKYAASLRREKPKLAKTLIRLSAQTINQPPGSLDPHADLVTFAEFLQWELAESRLASERMDRKRVAAFHKEIRDTGRVLAGRDPRYARLLRSSMVSPGKMIFSYETSTSSGNIEISVRPDRDTFKAIHSGSRRVEQQDPFYTQIKVLPRSELRSSQIQISDYEILPGDDSKTKEIKEIMRLLTYNFPKEKSGEEYAELSVDPDRDIDIAFERYEKFYMNQGYQSRPMQDIPDIGELERVNVPGIHPQLLRMMSFKALEEEDPRKKRIWTAMFLHITPVRNIFIQSLFPGVMYFLAAYDKELKGQIKETIIHSGIQNDGLYLNQDGTFLEGTEYDQEDAEENVMAYSKATTELINQFVKSKNTELTFDEPMPSLGNTNEFFTMLKPPGTLSNPKTILQYFLRIFAFGYQPTAIRAIRGSELPNNFVRRQYPEIADWALMGNEEILSSNSKEQFRSRYQDFYGKEILDPPSELSSHSFPPSEKVRLELNPHTHLPALPIIGFEQVLKDHSNGLRERQVDQKRAWLHEKYAKYYDLIEQGQYVLSKKPAGTAERLWSRQRISDPPNTRDVTLFRDKDLYGGKPFFVPNMFFSGLVNLYKNPDHVILAVVMQRKNIPGAANWDQLRNNFMGGGSKPDESMPGSFRWDSKRGKLGNNPKQITDLKNGIHGSASAIEALMETQLWFANINGEISNEKLLPIDRTTFGRALIQAGYTEDQIWHMISNPHFILRDKKHQESDKQFKETTLKDLIKHKNSDEALEIIRSLELPFYNRNPRETAPINFASYQEIARKYSDAHLGIEKNAISDSITPLDRSELRAAEKGRLMVMVGPSGAGKTKLMQMLINKYENQFQAVTQFTTRPPRPKEIDGVDYHFISGERFQALEKGDELTLIRGRIARYGILKGAVEEMIREGKTPILNFQDPDEIEQLKNIYPDIPVDVFVILPMEVKTWNEEASNRVSGLVRERLIRRDPEISQADVSDRIQSAVTSIPKLLELPDISIIVNEKGKSDIAFAKLEKDLRRSEARFNNDRAIAVIGPSVSGKNELIRGLIQEDGGHRFQEIIQFTTRSPRPKESDGVDYHFITPENFRSLEKDESVTFIRGRTAQYGISNVAIQEAIDQGKTPIFNLQDAEEIEQLKSHYPKLKIDVYVILPMKIDAWDKETSKKIADLMKKRLVQRDPQISDAHIADRIQSAMVNIPKLLKLPMATVIFNEEGKLDAALANFTAAVGRSEVRSSIYSMKEIGADPSKLEAAKIKGSEILKQGRLGVVINTADVGAHPYFSESLNPPVRMLRAVAHQGGRDITAAELKLRHVESIANEENANISIDIGIDRGFRNQVDAELEKNHRYGLKDRNTPLGLFNLGHVPYLLTRPTELIHAYRQVKRDVPPAVHNYIKTQFDILKSQSDILPLRNEEGKIKGSNMGNMDLLIQFVLSGQFRRRLNEGKDIFYFSNGEDLGGLIDKAKIGLFANAPEKIWFMAAEADQVFHISEIDSNQGKWVVVVRKGNPVISNLPKGFSVAIENGRPVIRKKERGEEREVGIVIESGEPEYGAYLVKVNGQPRFVERIAFPLGSDFQQLNPVWINTNQLLLKADAILEFFNLTRKEYLDIDQESLLKKVGSAVTEKMKTYTQINWVPLLINNRQEAFPAVKFVRVLADLSANMESGYLLIDRDSHYGWYPLVGELDPYLLKTKAQIEDILQDVSLSGHPVEDLMANENAVEFRDDYQGKKMIFHGGGKEVKDRTFIVSAMTEKEFEDQIYEMIRLKLKQSRFPGLNSEFFLGSAVEEDFLGKGLLKEFSEAEKKSRSERLDFLLERIYHSPYRYEFLKFLWNHKHSLVTFRNVNTPIYAVLVNYLLGRPLQDRRFVEDHRLNFFAENETLDQHPVFGITAVAQLPFNHKDEITLPAPPKDRPLRILFFGAGEKYGENSKLDYLREILRALPDQWAERVEIHAWDINFPEMIYELDDTAQYVTPKRAYAFDAQGNYFDRERQIHFKKLNVNDAREMATTEQYNLAEANKFDLVISSRVEIWYKRERQMRDALFRNVTKHLAPGGILLYDNYATDRLRVVRRPEANQIETAGYISYQDVAAAEKDLKRILRKFIISSSGFQKNNTLSLKHEQIENILRTAYELASKYVDEGQYIFEKKIFASFVAQFSQNPISTAAILVHELPEEVIQKAFPPPVADALIHEMRSFGKPEPSNGNHFGDVFYRLLEENFFRPQYLEPRAADSFLTDTTRIIGNSKFTIEHGLALKQDSDHEKSFVPALRIVNHQTNQAVIYFPPEELRGISRPRSEIRDAFRNNIVPLSERLLIGEGHKPGQAPYAEEILKSIQNMPQRGLKYWGSDVFSLSRQLQRSEIITVRQSNASKAEAVKSWKQGKAFGAEDLGVVNMSGQKIVIEETLAKDFVENGLTGELVSVIEEKQLQSVLEEAQVPQSREKAQKILADAIGASVINSDHLRSRPDDYLYYFTARKYGLERKDKIAQKIAAVYSLREYRKSEVRLIGQGNDDWKKARSRVLPANPIQGAILVTEEQLASGTVTQAEIISRMQEDPYGQIQLHFITKPGRDLDSAQAVLRRMMGKEADRLLFHAATNPHGRIYLHAVPKYQSMRAAVNRVSAGLRQALLPPPGETQVQDYQMVLIADEKTALNVKHNLTKFIARDQNIGLLSAAYLFIPYRGNIPDSIFGNHFYKGDIFNTYFLTPLENLGFFLRESAKIQRHILTQA